MNCKDCVHYDICEKLRPIEYCMDITCSRFKNKANVIELPCKVGDIFYGLNETEYDDYEVLGFKWGKRRGDDEYVLIVLTVYDMEFVWGEEAFLTKEEVEQKLKGGADNG